MITAFGYVMVAAASLLIRQVVVGRVADTPADMRDLMVALTSGDMEAVTEIMARRGNNLPDTGADEPVSGSVVPGSGASMDAVKFGSKVVALGEAAKGYVWGATGPEYYDCSGLIWRALYDLGYYKGQRFTTSSFEGIASTFAEGSDGSVYGDIVLWPTRHIGIVIGGDKMYSARSTTKGIGYSSIAGDTSVLGQPKFYRLKADF